MHLNANRKCDIKLVVMITKTVQTPEIGPVDGQVGAANLELDIENFLATTTGWFVDGKLYSTKMRTFGHRVLLGTQGGDGSYTDELRPGLRAVMPSEGDTDADVVVLRETDVLCFKVTDIFSKKPRVRESGRETYARSGKNPEPLWIQPDAAVQRVHLIDATRISEYGLLQQADKLLQQRAARLREHMTPDQIRRLQLPAIALHHVAADLGRRGIAAA